MLNEAKKFGSAGFRVGFDLRRSRNIPQKVATVRCHS
jgi:hypothetical protein